MQSESMTFPDVLALYHARKFTGRMCLDWAQGHVVVVEIPREPERVKVNTRRVDNRAPSLQDLTR